MIDLVGHAINIRVDKELLPLQRLVVYKQYKKVANDLSETSLRIPLGVANEFY